MGFEKNVLKKVKNHVRKNHRLYGQLVKSKKVIVNSYHNLGFNNELLGKNLKIEAYTKDNVVECFRHKKYRILFFLGFLSTPSLLVDFARFVTIERYGYLDCGRHLLWKSFKILLVSLFLAIHVLVPYEGVESPDG